MCTKNSNYSINIPSQPKLFKLLKNHKNLGLIHSIYKYFVILIEWIPSFEHRWALDRSDRSSTCHQIECRPNFARACAALPWWRRSRSATQSSWSSWCPRAACRWAAGLWASARHVSLFALVIQIKIKTLVVLLHLLAMSLRSRDCDCFSGSLNSFSCAFKNSFGLGTGSLA